MLPGALRTQAGGKSAQRRGKRSASLAGRHVHRHSASVALHLDSYATVGVVAQEAQALFPQAVSTGADGNLRVDYGLLL